jgi:GT2 family glycosyltransferase
MAGGLSVIVSTYGNYGGLRRVLDGYEAKSADTGDFEVLIVVDQADPDPDSAIEAVGARGFQARVLRGEIPGLSANRNAGWRAAATPLVMFTDNDTIPEPQLVAEHLAWHSREPAEEVAVLGHVRWAREVTVTPFMHWLDHGIQFDFPFIDGIEAGWGRFYGANVSAKRAFVERVGGFDEQRFPYGYEDLDFSYRANELGLRLLYNRHAVVEHLREYDLEFYKQRVRRIAFAEREFVRLHPDVPPFFFNLYSAALEGPPANGRGRFLIRRIRRTAPVIGPLVWNSADLYFRQELAPDFLEAWAEAESDPSTEGPVAPMLGELEEGSASASDSGPKYSTTRAGTPTARE